MNTLRGASSRAARPFICTHCVRSLRPRRVITSISVNSYNSLHYPRPILRASIRSAVSLVQQHRAYTTSPTADSIIDEIQEQYATAKDEFEIAMEETEKKSVYAADDREAAKEELGKLKELFENALQGENGEEVKRRVGNRIRELENAVKAMEELALED